MATYYFTTGPVVLQDKGMAKPAPITITRVGTIRPVAAPGRSSRW